MLLAALALFFAPLAMAGSAGAAAPHLPAASAASHETHCGGDQAPQDEKGSKKRMAGCVSACSALPAVEPRMGGLALPVEGAVRLAMHQILVGIAPEGETPPPRITPEI